MHIKVKEWNCKENNLIWDNNIAHMYGLKHLYKSFTYSCVFGDKRREKISHAYKSWTKTQNLYCIVKKDYQIKGPRK